MGVISVKTLFSAFTLSKWGHGLERVADNHPFFLFCNIKGDDRGDDRTWSVREIVHPTHSRLYDVLGLIMSMCRGDMRKVLLRGASFSDPSTKRRVLSVLFVQYLIMFEHYEKLDWSNAYSKLV